MTDAVPTLERVYREESGRITATLIRLMGGREIKDIYPRVPHTLGKPVLELHSLCGEKKPRSDRIPTDIRFAPGFPGIDLHALTMRLGRTTRRRHRT